MAVAGVPLARGHGAFEEADVRVAAIAFVALIAAIVQGWAWLVPASIALIGGSYAAELAIDDVPLDAAAPIVAVGLLVAAELAYWSLDERNRATGDAGQDLRRTALVALGAAGTLLLGVVLLALVDEVRARGLALDVGGVVAAAAVLITVAAIARDQSSKGS